MLIFGCPAYHTHIASPACSNAEYVSSTINLQGFSNSDPIRRLGPTPERVPCFDSKNAPLIITLNALEALSSLVPLSLHADCNVLCTNTQGTAQSFHITRRHM